MPVPHLEIRIVQRSKGSSAVAGAAYQAGEKLFSEYDQKAKDHRRKQHEVVYTEIMLPANAPPEYADRATLWNSVEEAEKQWNSQLARRFVVALPREVPLEMCPQMLKEYCNEHFVSKGMCCDFAIHDPDPPGHNPHCHIMLMAHERIMAQALEPFKDKYDYCLIDCMPSLGILTVASLVAADRVLIPVQAQHFALKGVVSLIKSINQITRRIKPELEIDGIVLTMVDRRTNLSKDVCAALRNSYGYALKIYRTEIPISTRTAESASSAHSVLSYDASGAASVAYKTLAKEVVDNERVRQQHHTPLTR